MAGYWNIVKTKEDGAKIRKIFYAYSLKLEKTSNNNSALFDSRVTFEFGRIIVKQFAGTICGAVQNTFVFFFKKDFSKEFLARK